MSDAAKRLQERRASVWEQMKSLADDAATENRNFDGEEQRQWDAMNGELTALDSRIQAFVDGEKRAKEAQEAFQKVENRRQEVATPGDDSLVSEVRSWLTGSNPVNTLELRRGSQKVDFRALSRLTNGAGGFTVPQGFYNQLVQNLIVSSGILRAGATVIQTDSGEPLPVPKTTSHPVGALVAEAGVIPTSEPVLGQITLGSYKYGDLIQASNELLTDTGVDLEGYLSKAAGRAVGNALGAHLVNGSGSNQPRGLLLDTTLGVTSATGTGGAPTADNMIDLFYSVIAPYRQSPEAGWLMNDQTVASVRKLKDSQGRYLWEPSLQVGAPDSFLGKPVFTDPNMPTVATSAKSIVFGDMSRYFVRLVGGVRFERSIDFAFNTDLVTFRAVVRGDGALVDLTGAIKHFAGAAT